MVGSVASAGDFGDGGYVWSPGGVGGPGGVGDPGTSGGDAACAPATSCYCGPGPKCTTPQCGEQGISGCGGGAAMEASQAVEAAAASRFRRRGDGDRSRGHSASRQRRCGGPGGAGGLGAQGASGAPGDAGSCLTECVCVPSSACALPIRSLSTAERLAAQGERGGSEASAQAAQGAGPVSTLPCRMRACRGQGDALDCG